VRALALRSPFFLGSLKRNAGRTAPRTAHRSSVDPSSEINDIQRKPNEKPSFGEKISESSTSHTDQKFN
jgi:hypothetical protein